MSYSSDYDTLISASRMVIVVVACYFVFSMILVLSKCILNRQSRRLLFGINLISGVP